MTQNTHLKGQPAELRATITIVRAGTGAVETYDLIGRPAAEPAQPTPTEKDTDHGRHSFDRGA